MKINKSNKFKSKYQEDMTNKISARIIIIVSLLLFAYQSFAADPPMYSDYKSKVGNDVANAWQNTDDELAGDTSSLSSSVVYYDAASVGWQLVEIDPTLEDIFMSYLPKHAEITARSYISYIFPPSGYTVFPHGIYREWTRTNSSRMLLALTHLHACQTENSNISGFCVPNASYERVAYARDLAYQIHTKIYAERAGITSDGYLDEFVDYGLATLDNWHNGNFVAEPAFNVRQSFMVGLLLSALIEYYDEYEQDARIPVAVKIAIDDLWTDAWWPDLVSDPPSDHGDSANYSTMTSGYGAFKYWMDWDGDHYVWDANHMPNSADVSPDLNNLIGPAYIWYALYSGDNNYRTKAEDIWKGWIGNGFSEYDKQFNQGSRQVYNFIKWYNKSTGDVCDDSHPWLCTNQGACEGQQFNWCIDECIRSNCAIVIIRADVDQSSFINSTDALLTLRNSLGLNMSSTNWQTSSTTGDVNCNSNTNSTDALLILRSSLGLDMAGTGW